jgi:UDP-N-acetyl-D-glucosamine dehydrogenase
MPEYVVERTAEALNSARKALNGSRVHVFGVAYKRDVNDLRESPALDIMELLIRRGAQVSYTDPYIPSIEHGTLNLKSVPEADAADGADCALIITDHKVFDYPRMAETFPLVVDTRNALRKIESRKIFRL